MKLKMTIEEALEFADEWSRGMTLHEGSQGWRVVCLLLAEEVRRLTPVEAAALKTVAAFEALGTAQHAGELLMARGNCETAMVALKAALFNNRRKVTPLGLPIRRKKTPPALAS